jgi:hypothetical protein
MTAVKAPQRPLSPRLRTPRRSVSRSTSLSSASDDDNPGPRRSVSRSPSPSNASDDDDSEPSKALKPEKLSALIKAFVRFATEENLLRGLDLGVSPSMLPIVQEGNRLALLVECSRLGIDITPDTPDNSTKLLVVLYAWYDNPDSDWKDRRAHLIHLHEWQCPLCNLHGPLPSIEVLQKHVELDHSGGMYLRTRWQMVGDLFHLFLSYESSA